MLAAPAPDIEKIVCVNIPKTFLRQWNLIKKGLIEDVNRCKTQRISSQIDLRVGLYSGGLVHEATFSACI